MMSEQKRLHLDTEFLVSVVSPEGIDKVDSKVYPYGFISDAPISSRIIFEDSDEDSLANNLQILNPSYSTNVNSQTFLNKEESSTDIQVHALKDSSIRTPEPPKSLMDDSNIFYNNTSENERYPRTKTTNKRIVPQYPGKMASMRKNIDYDSEATKSSKMPKLSQEITSISPSYNSHHFHNSSINYTRVPAITSKNNIKPETRSDVQQNCIPEDSTENLLQFDFLQENLIPQIIDSKITQLNNNEPSNNRYPRTKTTSHRFVPHHAGKMDSMKKHISETSVKQPQKDSCNFNSLNQLNTMPQNVAVQHTSPINNKQSSYCPQISQETNNNHEFNKQYFQQNPIIHTQHNLPPSPPKKELNKSPTQIIVMLAEIIAATMKEYQNYTANLASARKSGDVVAARMLEKSAYSQLSLRKTFFFKKAYHLIADGFRHIMNDRRFKDVLIQHTLKFSSQNFLVPFSVELFNHVYNQMFHWTMNQVSGGQDTVKNTEKSPVIVHQQSHAHNNVSSQQGSAQPPNIGVIVKNIWQSNDHTLLNNSGITCPPGTFVSSPTKLSIVPNCTTVIPQPNSQPYSNISVANEQRYCNSISNYHNSVRGAPSSLYMIQIQQPNITNNGIQSSLQNKRDISESDRGQTQLSNPSNDEAAQQFMLNQNMSHLNQTNGQHYLRISPLARPNTQQNYNEPIQAFVTPVLQEQVRSSISRDSGFMSPSCNSSFELTGHHEAGFIPSQTSPTVGTNYQDTTRLPQGNSFNTRSNQESACVVCNRPTNLIFCVSKHYCSPACHAVAATRHHQTAATAYAPQQYELARVNNFGSGYNKR